MGGLCQSAKWTSSYLLGFFRQGKALSGKELERGAPSGETGGPLDALRLWDVDLGVCQREPE